MIDLGPTPPYRTITEVRDAFRAQKAEAARRRGVAKAKAKRQVHTALQFEAGP